MNLLCLVGSSSQKVKNLVTSGFNSLSMNDGKRLTADKAELLKNEIQLKRPKRHYK